MLLTRMGRFCGVNNFPAHAPAISWNPSFQLLVAGKHVAYVNGNEPDEDDEDDDDGQRYGTRHKITAAGADY